MKSPCDKCGGTCCKPPLSVQFSVCLEDDELQEFKDDSVEFNGQIGLKLVNGYCLHFKDGKCTIYERRPKGCRNYFCADSYNRNRLDSFLFEHPELVKMIEEENK